MIMEKVSSLNNTRSEGAGSMSFNDWSSWAGGLEGDKEVAADCTIREQLEPCKDDMVPSGYWVNWLDELRGGNKMS